VGDRAYRTWLGYLAAVSLAFQVGLVALHQVLAHRGAGADARLS